MCSQLTSAPERDYGASLNAARRRQEIERLAAGEPVDLLVVGGGITGVGVALDAAARGLSVALVERVDLAFGTSRWSSKLIHGGLRYLRQFEVGLAWESARERHIMLRWTAPHLVHPLPFLVPLNKSVSPGLGILSDLGIRFGDGLRMLAGGPRDGLPRPRRISGLEAMRLAPALAHEGLRGAILFWDGQAEDDARIVVAVARTAARLGARILTRCAFQAADGAEAQILDTLGQRHFTIRARHIVNATGVWAGEVDPQIELSPSKGSHLVLNASALGNPRAAVLTPVPHESARWVGATPVGDGRVIVGVTDDAHTGPLESEPRVTESEERFLLEVLAHALARPVRPDEIIGRYAGFRPLITGGSGSSADLSRRHSLINSADSHMTSIVGGKFTTYRLMAEQTVDHVVALTGLAAAACRTARLPLVGAGTEEMLAGVTAPARLVRRYGMEATAVAALAGNDPSLLKPIAPGIPTLPVELLFGLRHEGALHVDDVLDRRVRLGLVPEQRARALALANHLMAAEVAVA